MRSWSVVRATSPVSRSPPRAVSVSAITASSPARSSSASATASSAAARRASAVPAPQAAVASAAAVTIASTSASVVSATGSPTARPVRGSNPWIISPPYRGSGSGLRPGLARKSKSQPWSAWVMCSL